MTEKKDAPIDADDEWGEDEAPLLPAFEFGKNGENVFVALNRADQAAVYHAYDYYGAYGASTAVEKVK